MKKVKLKTLLNQLVQTDCSYKRQGVNKRDQKFLLEAEEGDRFIFIIRQTDCELLIFDQGSNFRAASYYWLSQYEHKAIYMITMSGPEYGSIERISQDEALEIVKNIIQERGEEKQLQI